MKSCSRLLYRLSFLLLLTSLVFIGSGFAQNEENLNTSIPIDPDIKKGKLDNGITYYIKKNKKPENRMELRLAVNAGSILEDDDQQGLAHLVEHMAFNGTKNFSKSEIVDYLESVGVKFGPHLNAYTSFDETVYMLQIPTDSKDIIEKGFQILEDWAHNVSFEDEEIDKERGVVIEEWRLGRGANARMRDKYYPVLFQGSQYAKRLPIGKKHILESCSYETLKKFYKDWYRPDLMAVVVVGDFDVNEMETLIKSHFSKVPVKKDPRERINFDVPDHTEVLVSVNTDKEASGTMVRLYYKHDKIAEDKTIGEYRESIKRQLYNGMINSRLDELNQKADPPFIYGYTYYGGLNRNKDAYVSVAMVKEEGILRGIKTLAEENERVLKFGFTQTELEREKTATLRYMDKALKENGKSQSRQYASEFIRNYFTDEPIPGIAYENELHKRFMPGITLEEINRHAETWITDENMVLVVTAPDKEGLKVPSADILATLGKAKSTKLLAYEDITVDKPLLNSEPKATKITRTTLINEIDLTELKLANGIVVYLKPTDFKNDEVRFRAYSKGGSGLYPEKDDVSSSFASELINSSGVGDFDNISLSKKLSSKIVRVSPFISELSEGLSGSASPEDLETMFQLIYLYFTQPRKDITAYKALISKYKGWLQNRGASPNAAFSDTFNVTMAQYHPRRRPFTEALIDEFDLEKAFEIYQDRFADASDFVFFFVGNFDIEQMKPMIEIYLGGLPSTSRNENWKDPGVRTPVGVIKKTVYKGIEPKSSVRIAWTGSFDYNFENRFALESMLRVLRIKLRESMREDKGGVYGVGCWGSPSKHPVQQYRITISFGCAPENVDDLIKTAFAEIERLKQKGADEKELTKIKEIYTRERETKLKENNTWLSELQFYYTIGENLANIISFDKHIDKLSSKDIQKAAGLYFNMDNYVQVVLKPEQPTEN